MNLTELTRVIDTVGRDRGIKKEILIGALEQAILVAAQRKYGPKAILEAHYNEDSGEIDLFQFKKVVEIEEDVLNPDEEICYDDAIKLDPDAVVGDELGMKVDNPHFGRIDAQTAKQVIFQKVRDAERDLIYNEYISRKGEIVSGIARRMERGNLVIDLGRTDALLPRRGVIQGESFRPGDRVQAYLQDVASTTRGPQIYLSRTAPEYLIKLFEVEVPELRDEIIEIKKCVREPGVRAKISVATKERDIDPKGACIGAGGARVQAVSNELRGEKIDIVLWSDNPVVFVREALSPADISSIRLDEANQSMEIVVEDDQLSLAIGKRGQNVRLAAQLTGWKLDIVSKAKLQKRVAQAVFNFQHMEGVSETLAHSIFQSGFSNLKQIALAEVASLQKIPGFESEEAATNLQKKAEEVIEKTGDILMMDHPDLETTGTDAKGQAEARLKEMLEQEKNRTETE